MSLLVQQPLSLYIHIPWCVQKCPYCDFNSHGMKSELPEQAYTAALLKDLDDDITRFNLSDRKLHSIFIGGGTPSLFSAKAIGDILAGVFTRFDHDSDIEVTLEANPGTVEADKFVGFAEAGVSRLSIGVQSFESDKLIKLGRIHDNQQAIRAAELAKSCGVKSFNLDLMHGLPGQSLDAAMDDLAQAIALKPDHLSWYQLTIEPNTAFGSKPPKLPEDETLWDIQEHGVSKLADAGYQQYEISAYSQLGKQSKHNLNYWRFGDYLGIGCGAHGKITDSASGKIYRTVKVKHPKGYLEQGRPALDHLNTVTTDELPFEFMMNQLRLRESFDINRFTQTTGLALTTITEPLAQASAKGLLINNQQNWQVSTLGHRYLNDLLELFL
ncbi:radical SAM family heme chaperone HemW [Thalassotalea euphylliae]|uniref:Heme chaperone HemW n=1 Tax=Thalassotalea euphylliae TaxID=1655234 RepID=A0A3E0UH52_9GAMM|nr:radical SAM family heme chaperone HemW [Thalassotalea euphylliae]REL36338.1 radical SAM family heme chaperone HemW [Thalassotalea euphylliae]